MEFKTECYGHQFEGFNYGMNNKKFILGDEQGLGKTKQSIDIAIGRKIHNNIEKCLIVCGVNSTKYNWEEEVKIHSFEESIVIDGNKNKKLQMIEEWKNSNIYFGIINIESLRIVEILVALRQLGIEMIIIDEIHKCKNPMSKQGQAIHLLPSEYRIGLTGTPIQNKVIDVFNLLKWVGVERRNFYAFRNRYCILGPFKNIIGHKNLGELNAILNSCMLRRLKDEVLDLPPKIYKNEYVELTSKQRVLYRQNRESLLEMIRMGLNIPDNPLTILDMLRKVTGGLLTEDNPKLDRVEELLEDIKEEDRKVIIFSNYKQVTLKIRDRLNNKYGKDVLYIDGDVEGEERQQIVNEFQKDNKFKIIIGTVGAMGTGLTLNTAEYVIFFDKAYNPADNEQAEDRSHRIGTRNSVNIISLITKNTIDERIESLLVEKKKVIDKVVDGEFKFKSNRDVLNYLLDV